MATRNKTRVMGYNVKKFHDLDGKTQKPRIHDKKASWMPADAGMTQGVGGDSH